MEETSDWCFECARNKSSKSRIETPPAEITCQVSASMLDRVVAFIVRCVGMVLKGYGQRHSIWIDHMPQNKDGIGFINLVRYPLTYYVNKYTVIYTCRQC